MTSSHRSVANVRSEKKRFRGTFATASGDVLSVHKATLKSLSAVPESGHSFSVLVLTCSGPGVPEYTAHEAVRAEVKAGEVRATSTPPGGGTRSGPASYNSRGFSPALLRQRGGHQGRVRGVQGLGVAIENGAGCVSERDAGMSQALPGGSGKAATEEERRA